MQYVNAIHETDDTGLMAWWEPGAQFYLYQMRDFISDTKLNSTSEQAGIKYSIVNVDPMYGEDLSTVIKECYQGYQIVEFNPQYSG